jgi:hypothetical protein
MVKTRNRVSSVAATSLSDIVCGFHVAACCIKTTSEDGWFSTTKELDFDHLSSFGLSRVPMANSIAGHFRRASSKFP